MVEDLQFRVRSWVVKVFGIECLTDKVERATRLLEEALELGQAMGGLDRERAHELVDYVFDRKPGEVGQEIGGVFVTLLAVAESTGFDAISCGRVEIERIEHPGVITRCQLKQNEKWARGVGRKC